MNSTRWHSLMEFVKFLGRERLCRVEDGEKGLEIAWIDNSPEALRRADAIRMREKLEKGDEEREQKLIKEQIIRAQQGNHEEDIDDKARELQREEGDKITLNFGVKAVVKCDMPRALTQPLSHPEAATEEPRSSIHVGSSRPRNVFTTTSKKKKNALKTVSQRPTSEVERIMKDELVQREARAFNSGSKKQRLA